VSIGTQWLYGMPTTRLHLWKASQCMGTALISCRKMSPRQQRHSSMNDILWIDVKWAQIPATKELANLIMQNGKRPDGSTLIPWSRGKPMAWDVTVADTYVESHIGDTATEAGAAASQAVAKKSTSMMNWPARTSSTQLP